MGKSLRLAKAISKELGKNWTSELEEIGLFKIFEPVYKLNNSIEVLNTLTAAIVYSYDNESKWIDLKADGYTINKNILFNLGADLSIPIYEDFCTQSNEEICEAIGNYLDLIKNWKFVTARKMIDFHSKTIMQKEPDLSAVDEEKKPKVRENISRSMREAVAQRNAAELLIKELNTEYVNTDHRTKQDFGEDYVQKTLDLTDDDNKPTIDILSWRHFIRYTVLPLKNNKKATAAGGQ